MGEEAVFFEEFSVVVPCQAVVVGQVCRALPVPVVVVVEDAGVEVVGLQGAADGVDAAGGVGFNGKEFAGLFMLVDGFHFFSYQLAVIS